MSVPRTTAVAAQEPCIDCGECLRVCPASLDPQALFLALVGDDWGEARRQDLDGCTGCNRCVEACPSHIPLLDWFRWGEDQLARRVRADDARARFVARNARLARERAERAGARRHAAAVPVRTIAREEVLAAIARGRAKYRRSSMIAASPQTRRSDWSGDPDAGNDQPRPDPPPPLLRTPHR